MDGDGDITRPENITAFRNFVLESTEKRGLHFLMADGVRLFHNCRLIFVTILLLQSFKNQKNLLTLYHTLDEFTESCTWWVEQRFSGFCVVIGSLLVWWLWSPVGFLCGRPGKHPGDPEQTTDALSVPHSPLYTQDRYVYTRAGMGELLNKSAYLQSGQLLVSQKISETNENISVQP